MRQLIIIIGSVVMLVASSCHKFLEEDKAGFISPDKYYATEGQVRAAVNGTYAGLDDIFSTGIGVANSPCFMLEYLTGYSTRLRGSGLEDNQFLRLDYVDPANNFVENWWKAIYYPLENCNSAIDNLTRTTILPEAAKNKYLGEVYFLRAWYYFMGVRLYGEIPLKTTPTTDLSETRIPKASIAQLYDQIVSDLQRAEQSGLPWTDGSGHVSMGAVKSLLAKVYITMAGYPLQKGTSHYQLAYAKAKEVIDSKAFSLFADYADLRQQSLQNTGEHIFMLQRERLTAGNILHFYLMPFPDLPITIQPAYGGGLAPRVEFYNAFAAVDKRRQEGVFFYTSHPEFNKPSSIITLPGPLIYKYWDDLAEQTGKAGLNFSYLRYADVLLLCAEAKAQVDGGTTSDATAVDAYHQVLHRAFPASTKPVQVASAEVLKERFLELCFEWQTWYDMLRTRKALNTSTGKIVELIGYQAPNHVRAFTEQDLRLPIPLSEVQKNPLLK
ncbi:RagB/SusD family nutrient uptake outer membrane protein [Paraflavitalea sp. CAU 1676]|uniref:RagB/SusD family nutrient uptake outer membrane protein n=1 Tax=Paraflavitalea sp. CAU 1676 TaxID=3032598 RepID=UPI0023DC7C7A|nr:RagB/SusD family nutrient uptake outer membrane protein [Paraflavitalea sp. CAU 1676]MDF2192312.1 RagB/SusD family nutrient uptake outer membrane protein [Paraflavitalea sp. CAU 1676]